MKSLIFHLLVPVFLSTFFVLYFQDHAVNYAISDRYFFITENNVENSLPLLAQRVIDDGRTAKNMRAIVEFVEPIPTTLPGLKSFLSKNFPTSARGLATLFREKFYAFLYKVERNKYIFSKNRPLDYVVRVVSSETPPHSVLLEKAHLKFLEDQAFRELAGEGEWRKVIAVEPIIQSSIDEALHGGWMFNAVLIALVRSEKKGAAEIVSRESGKNSLEVGFHQYFGRDTPPYEEGESAKRAKLRFYLKFVLNYGNGDVDTAFETVAKGTSLLHVAALRHDYELVSLLTSMGADVLAEDENRRSPLFYSASSVGNVAVEEYRKWLKDPPLPLNLAKLPFSYGGADTSELCNSSFAKRSDLIDKYSPIDAKVTEILLQSCEGHVGKAEYLLKQVDKYGNTPLHAAAWSGNAEVGELLLRHSETNVNAKTRGFEQTPLMIAVSRNQGKFVRILLSQLNNSRSNPLEINAIDKWGRTALDYARSTKNQPMESILAGARGESGGGEFAVPWGATEGCDIAWLNVSGVEDSSKEMYSGIFAEGDTVQSLSIDFFDREFRSLRRPVLISGELSNWLGDKQFWTMEHMKKKFPDLTVSLVYPHLYGKDSMWTEPQESTLSDYFDFIQTKVSPGSGGTNPYVFDRDFLSQNAEEFLSQLAIPRFFDIKDKPTEIQFSIGAKGSGAHPHYHEAAWNAVTQGTKKWTMYRQDEAFLGAMSGSQFTAHEGDWGEGMDNLNELKCVQNEGDLIYVPHGWGHTLVNEGEVTIGVAVQFQEDSIDFGTPN